MVSVALDLGSLGGTSLGVGWGRTMLLVVVTTNKVPISMFSNALFLWSHSDMPEASALATSRSDFRDLFTTASRSKRLHVQRATQEDTVFLSSPVPTLLGDVVHVVTRARSNSLCPDTNSQHPMLPASQSGAASPPAPPACLFAPSAQVTTDNVTA